MNWPATRMVSWMPCASRAACTDSTKRSSDITGNARPGPCSAPSSADALAGRVHLGDRRLLHAVRGGRAGIGLVGTGGGPPCARSDDGNGFAGVTTRTSPCWPSWAWSTTGYRWSGPGSSPARGPRSGRRWPARPSSWPTPRPPCPRRKLTTTNASPPEAASAFIQRSALWAGGGAHDPVGVGRPDARTARLPVPGRWWPVARRARCPGRAGRLRLDPLGPRHQLEVHDHRPQLPGSADSSRIRSSSRGTAFS